jgi:pimeloyl-ACP methyl ester carboxylesterase
MKMEPYHPFRSAKARERFTALYEMRAKEWPVESETRMVQTSYGRTFVRISGDPHARPLVLLPGTSAHSLMWILCIQGLSAEFRTIAVDSIYDFGLSVYTRAMKNMGDFTGWPDELLTAMELGNPISLMGHSFGSALIFRYALTFPQRLSKMVALAPAATILPIKFSFILKSLPFLLQLDFLG